MHVLKFIVANNILRLRTDAEISRAELGEKICYSEDYILKWERAEAMPDDDAVAALAEAFGVTADYLLNPHDEWISKEEKEYLENTSTLASSGETKNLRREEEKNDEIPLAPSAEEAAAEPYGRGRITPLSISIGAIITLVIILFMATGGRFGCASRLPETETEAHVHEYVRWEMVSYPTIYSPGEMRRYCNSCDDYIVRVIPESTGSLFYDDNGDGTCTVTGIGHGPENSPWDFSRIVIPQYIVETDSDGNPIELRVVAIGEGFLSSFGDMYLENMQEIILPDTVRSIGGYAFIGTNINSIVLPKELTSIGEYAFANCENLYEIDIPDSVERIGEGAFKGCTSLRTVYAQESAVWQVEPFTFEGCVSLEYAEFNGITVVGESAFENCINLKAINTELFYSIEKAAFKGCISIGYIVFPKNLHYIGESAFEGCSNLLMIEFTENNDASAEGLSIDRYAFKDCTALTKIWNTYEIPARVECIGEYAFEGCTALEFVKIQSKEVGAYAFSGCTAMYGVEFGAGTMYIGEYAFDGCSSIVQITLPTGMKRVDEGAFRNCTGLESFCANGSLEFIGREVFNGCENLTTLDIYEMSEGGHYHDIFRGSKTITSVIVRTGNIPKNAFENCTSLESAVIGNGVSIIGEYAFAGCTELKSVLLHGGLTRINSYAFYECRALDMVMSGLPTSLTYIGKYAFARSGVTDFSTEAKAYVDDYAFFESALKSVTVSCDGTKFGKYVFANCYDLASITVEQGVTSIGMYMFSGCENYNLTSIELPDSVTSIYKGAFEKCNWLRQVTIKSTNISVGDNTFYYCQHLETINFSGTTDAAWDGTGSLGNVLEKTEGIASSVTIVCSDDNIIISK